MERSKQDARATATCKARRRPSNRLVRSSVATNKTQSIGHDSPGSTTRKPTTRFPEAKPRKDTTKESLRRGHRYGLESNWVQGNEQGSLRSSNNRPVKKFPAEKPPIPLDNLPAEKPAVPLDKLLAETEQSGSSSSPIYLNVPEIQKSPINLLTEIYKDVSFEFITVGVGISLMNPNQRYKIVCNVLGQSYEGYGASKKLAKLASACAALAELIENQSIPMDAPEPLNAEPCLNKDNNALLILHGEQSTVIANRIGQLVAKKYMELMGGDPVHCQRKVISAIIITDTNMPEKYDVIGIGTGTKCLSTERMSTQGIVVNDCHAEVVARRCFMLHLYNQLRMYAEASDPRVDIPESDLEPYVNRAWVGYRLRPSKKVYFYSSTAPCGDSRIFSPHVNLSGDINRHTQGKLRTKVNCGDGTIPVDYRKPSFQNIRLSTMSCSDKMMRWNVLGLQGALLSMYIYPIYLDRIILGSLLHKDHSTRALYGRLQNSDGTWVKPLSLPLPFSPRSPLLCKSYATAELRSLVCSPQHTVAWSKGFEKVEVLKSAAGMTKFGDMSMLCKQAMFFRWIYITEKLNIATNMIPNPKLSNIKLEGLCYADAKKMATQYQQAQLRLYRTILRMNLGKWVKKPITQKRFYCMMLNADPNDLFISISTGTQQTESECD